MTTLTTLESFTGGADGADPGYGSLLIDANGNLFGTTLSGGINGGGTVFELVNTGSGYTFQTLASFDPNDTVNGNTPFAGLTMDANGNLFGVTQAGGATGSGTVFELAKTDSGYAPVQTLASFSGTDGAGPMGALLADANGDLFGTTQSGGLNGQGSVFELVNTGSGYSLQSLYSFSYTDGAAPTGPLIADANGNLFGTTQSGGGDNGQGTVFELVNTGSGYTLQTLAEFTGSNGSYLYAGLIADAQGDLFGASYAGGAGGYGTVFELVNTGSGYAQPTTIATFDYGNTGGYVIGGLTIDSQGDIFGTAMAGGANSFGTVFELVHSGSGYSSPQVLYSFGGADGAFPEGGLVLDAQGNLYGTTAGGGTSGSGTVFEFGSAAPDAEQANLALKVNGGLGNPIGSAGEANVAFTVTGMQAGDTGVVTFTDSANHTVTVDVAAGQTRYAADFSTLSDGAISASLQVATNSQGTSFTPVAGNVVTLDTVAPAQPDVPADAAVIDGYVNAAGDTAAQTIGGTAEAGAAVSIYDNGHLVGSAIADGSGAWSYQVGHLADGAHSFAVTATDAAGNASALSAALSFTVQTGAPAQPAAPSDASVINGYVNAAHDTSGQTIGGTAEAGATVAIYDNGTQVATVVADNTGAWSYQVGTLIGGTSHSYAVTATNAAGNTSAMSEALSFKVDVAAPGQPTAPADAAVINGYVNAVHDTAGQTISGAAEAGATVAIYDNGTQVATVVADNSGVWSYQVGHLGDGAHSYAVTATDAAGNVSALSPSLSFTVDTAAPAQPGAPADGSVVSGYVNAVHDTAAQTISGTTEAGASVAIYDNGTQVATVVANGAGAWSYQVGHLADGSAHSYAVTATDAAGNVSAMSAALSFTVDTTAPAQPGAPADGSVVNGYVNAVHDTAAQTISGTTEAGASVAIYDNGTQVATVVANGAGAWSYQVGHLADGSAHSYAVTATDAAGNVSAMSAALSFTVDTTAPAQPGAPADGSVVSGYVNVVHDTAAQTISGTTEAGASVAIYDNGTQVATVVANGAGAWSYQVGHLADGSAHSYAVTATDAAGNVSAMSAALSFTVDTTAPAQPGAPADAAVVNGYVNAVHDTAAQTISGTTEAGASVAIYDNGTQVATVVANGAGAWSYQVGHLADGSAHSYAVTATDAAGNVSAMSAALSFTVDTTAPAQPGAPADAAVVNGYVNAVHDTAAQTISGTTEAGASVAIYDNGTQVATVVANGAGAWSYQVGHLADGSAHSYAVTATDAAGNVSAMSPALSFTVDTTAPAQPGAPADAAVISGYVNAVHDTAAQTISGTTEAGASVAIYDNGTQVATVVANGAGAWSYQVGHLADGSAHSYAVTATDAAGNASALSAALSFTVDTSAPLAPTGLSDAAVSGGYVNAAHDTAGQALTGTAEAGSVVTVWNNGVKLGTTTANAVTGAWSFNLGMLADGAQSLTATATDAAGNTGVASTALTFTVDTLAPASAVGQVTVGGNGVATVSGSAEAGSTVTLYDGGVLLGVVTAGTSGTWSYPVGVLSAGSSHSYAVTATDAAGNTSAVSAALSYTAAPAPPVTSDPPPAPPAQPAAPTDAAVHNGYVNAANDTAGQTIGGTTEAGALVTIYDHGTQVTKVTADAVGAWSWQVGVLADGSSHSYTVTAANAGGVSPMSGALSFAVDTTPPPAPTGLADASIVVGYVNKAHDTAGQTLTGHAEGGAVVTIWDNGVKLGTTTANASTGAWTFNLGVMADGVQSLTATATDAAGNTGAASAPLTFTVDATPPVPVVTDVTSAAQGQSVVSGTSEAGSTVTLFDGGQQVGVVTAGANGTWSVTLKLNGGSTHVFTETAVDVAGNTGASSGTAYWANPGNKALVGAAGDDVLIGAKGDTLTGGAGHDHFVFNVGFGNQTVTDFASGSDQLLFDHTLFTRASQVLAHAQQSGANTVITDTAGDQVVLQGVQLTALHATDFLLF